MIARDDRALARGLRKQMAVNDLAVPREDLSVDVDGVEDDIVERIKCQDVNRTRKISLQYLGNKDTYQGFCRGIFWESKIPSKASKSMDINDVVFKNISQEAARLVSNRPRQIFTRQATAGRD